MIGSHVGTSVEEVRMRVKDVLTNKVSEYSSRGHVCRKVLQASDASESEFRAYAIAKLGDPEFRAEAEKLRGRNLLCWCVQEVNAEQNFAMPGCGWN
jgi:hypothetical protein